MACLFLLDSLLQLALTSTHPAHLFDSLVPGVTWTTSKNLPKSYLAVRCCSALSYFKAFWDGRAIKVDLQGGAHKHAPTGNAILKLRRSIIMRTPRSILSLLMSSKNSYILGLFSNVHLLKQTDRNFLFRLIVGPFYKIVIG